MKPAVWGSIGPQPQLQIPRPKPIRLDHAQPGAIDVEVTVKVNAETCGAGRRVARRFHLDELDRL